MVALFVFLAVNLGWAVAKETSKRLSSKRPFTQERISVFRPVNKWDNWILWPQTDESPDCHVRGLTGAFCSANKALNLSFQKREELRIWQSNASCGRLILRKFKQGISDQSEEIFFSQLNINFIGVCNCYENSNQTIEVLLWWGQRCLHRMGQCCKMQYGFPWSWEMITVWWSLNSIIASWVEEPNKIFSSRLWWENMVFVMKRKS